MKNLIILIFALFSTKALANPEVVCSTSRVEDTSQPSTVQNDINSRISELVEQGKSVEVIDLQASNTSIVHGAGVHARIHVYETVCASLKVF